MIKAELMYFLGFTFSEIEALDLGEAIEYWSAIHVINAQMQKGAVLASMVPHWKKESDRMKYFNGLDKTINKFSESGAGNTISKKDFAQQFAGAELNGNRKT